MRGGFRSFPTADEVRLGASMSQVVDWRAGSSTRGARAVTRGLDAKQRRFEILKSKRDGVRGFNCIEINRCLLGASISQ